MPDHDIASLDLLGLRDHPDGAERCTHFDLPVTHSLCTPFEFLYGGSGIAASIEASERATGRPIQWITTQFLGSPAPGDTVEISVDVAVSGRATSQTRVDATVGDTTVISSLAAHNVRPDGDERGFRPMPDVPAPADSPLFAELFQRDTSGSFFDHFERRVAAGSFGRPLHRSPLERGRPVDVDRSAIGDHPHEPSRSLTATSDARVDRRCRDAVGRE